MAKIDLEKLTASLPKLEPGPIVNYKNGSVPYELIGYGWDASNDKVTVCYNVDGFVMSRDPEDFFAYVCANRECDFHGYKVTERHAGFCLACGGEPVPRFDYPPSPSRKRGW